MICFIEDYGAWDHTINRHALEFFVSYSIYPNILLASKTTWDTIDSVANQLHPENISHSGMEIGESEPDGSLRYISSFVTETYSLEFCLDEKVNEGYFVLVHDEHPTFDGEPVEKEREASEAVVYRRIA